MDDDEKYRRRSVEYYLRAKYKNFAQPEYDMGGWLQRSNWSLAPEPVLTAEQWDRLKSLLDTD